VDEQARGLCPRLAVDVHHGGFGLDLRRLRRIDALEGDGQPVLAAAVGA
jgi:hypothetical protein